MSDYIFNAVKSAARLSETFPFDPFLGYLAQSPKVVFFGLGKSYLAIKTSVAIANSYGLRWYTLDAVSALHGDMGIVGPRDLLVMVSNSGETTEMVTLAHHFRENALISITGKHENPLQHLAMRNFVVPSCGEFSPFDKAPTYSSVAVQLVLNHAICLLVEEKGLSHEAYSNNHPGGVIGEATS